jgi:DNA-binding response OmpR family regulator
VLVVDDEPAIRELLMQHLTTRSRAYDVLGAADGFEAGRLITTARPDVVLLDLRMPGLDGFQVCRQIKADTETAATIVIAMTGFHSPETETQILGCGAIRCFAKPIDPAVLSAFIDLQFDRLALGRSRRSRTLR